MLNKILGGIPFDVSLKGNFAVSPVRECKLGLVFENSGEYDYPVLCRIKIHSLIRVDSPEFDIVVPAEGKTEKTLTFSLAEDVRLCGGEKLCELEISEGVFDSKALFEFNVCEEMLYECRGRDRGVFCSRDGVFFGNKGEKMKIVFACLDGKDVCVETHSGSLEEYKNGDTIKLFPPMTAFECSFREDTSFSFTNPSNGERAYIETVNPTFLQEI